MKKKALSILAIAVILCAAFAVTTLAADIVLSGSCGVDGDHCGRKDD